MAAFGAAVGGGAEVIAAVGAEAAATGTTAAVCCVSDETCSEGEGRGHEPDWRAELC